MSAVARSTRALVATVAAFPLMLAGGLWSAPTASAATCTDVEVVFARGSGEAPGTGMVGGPFISSLTSRLAGRSVGQYAVNYLADYAQTSAGSGATDLTNHVVSQAAACPNTRFVLGGYSQGASVVDIAIGMNTTLGRGSVIPASLSGRIGAIAVFGNPSRLTGQRIDVNGGVYASKAIDDCNFGDPVCGGGVNTLAHLTYGVDGSATAAATFAAGKL